MREGVLVELVFPLRQVEEVEHHHHALGFPPLFEQIEEGRDVLVLGAGMVVPGRHGRAVEPLEPETEGLVADGGVVIEQFVARADAEGRIPDAEIEGPVVDAAPLQAIAEAADEAVHLDVVVFLAMHPAFEFRHRLCDRLRLGGCRVVLGQEEIGEIGDRHHVLSADHGIIDHQPVFELEIEEDLQDQDGIEIEVLVEPCCRRKRLHMPMLHGAGQHLCDGVDDVASGQEARSF